MFSHPIQVKIRLTVELNEETNSVLKSKCQVSNYQNRDYIYYVCVSVNTSHYILRVDRWPIKKNLMLKKISRLHKHFQNNKKYMKLGLLM